MKNQLAAFLFLSVLISACTSSVSEQGATDQTQKSLMDLQAEIDAKQPNMQLAKLTADSSSALTSIRRTFQKNNPGYDLFYRHQVSELKAEHGDLVVFVQEGGGTATVGADESSKISVGDIILMRESEHLQTDSLISFLSFVVPSLPFEQLPRFIRPDWDPNITDTPGGCATETGAYRRILLTWLKKVGPYRLHALNAHRVRIMDSFSHYHPVEGGFDEFYLVQMAMPGAKIITSRYTELLVENKDLSRDQVDGLIEETPLAVGDLLYLPRGVMHRGYGGLLAQVITVPGFKPGAEIGMDYHLRKINERLALDGKDALPFHIAASDSIVIK